MTIKKQCRVSCIQMTSTDSVNDNLQQAEQLITDSVAAGANLVVLPEFFSALSADEKLKINIAEEDGKGMVQDFLAQTAKAKKIHLIGGSIPIKNNQDPARVFSSCMVYDANGQRLCRYDKIHLFRFHDESGHFDETQTITAGTQVKTTATPFGRIGLSICYDLRFPELYRSMQQPDIIVIPSAFIPVTGKAHWELLLRARAVENLCYVIGAAQAGTHPGNRQTYGHSMIIDPWGSIITEATNATPQIITATINNEKQDLHRQQLPALKNRCLPITANTLL